MKICGRCKQEKELSCFSFKNKAKGTYSNECKICHQVLRNTYYRNNKDTEKERVKSVKQRHLSWYKELKATLSCKECGEDHPATLQFHHRDPSKKEFSIAEAMGRNTGKQKLLEEMNKCDVLCANCHAKLHWS